MLPILHIFFDEDVETLYSWDQTGTEVIWDLTKSMPKNIFEIPNDFFQTNLSNGLVVS